MKRLIILIAILISVCNLQAQIDTAQRNHPYNMFANISNNTKDWNDYWTSRKGDSLISAIINNDTVNAIVYRDTIGYHRVIEYVVFDSYIRNNKEYFIFSRNYEEGGHYYQDDCEKIYMIENYFTTEPNTKVVIETTPTTRGIGRHYLFYTDYTNQLNENEKNFLKNKYCLQWYDYE